MSSQNTRLWGGWGSPWGNRKAPKPPSLECIKCPFRFLLNLQRGSLIRYLRLRHPFTSSALFGSFHLEEAAHCCVVPEGWGTAHRRRPILGPQPPNPVTSPLQTALQNQAWTGLPSAPCWSGGPSVSQLLWSPGSRPHLYNHRPGAGQHGSQLACSDHKTALAPHSLLSLLPGGRGPLVGSLSQASAPLSCSVTQINCG